MNAALLTLALLAGAPPGLDGTWLFDDFRRSGRATDAELGLVWFSPVVITGDTFAVKRFLGTKADFAGQLRFDPAAPTHLEVVLKAYDLTPMGLPMTIPAGPRPGVFRSRGNTLEVAFSRQPGGKRPTGVGQIDDEVMRMTLNRAPAGVVRVPKEVTVTVTDATGKPASGVQLTDNVNFGAPTRPVLEAAPDGKLTPGDKLMPDDGTTRPQLRALATTDANGQAKVPFRALDAGTLIAFDPASNAIAYLPVSPAGLATGSIAVKLLPGREVVVKVSCPDLPGGRTDAEPPKPPKEAPKRVEVVSSEIVMGVQPLGWVTSYLHTGNRRVAFVMASTDNTLRFTAPIGDHTLQVYGAQVIGRDVQLTVPPGEGVFNAAPVELAANSGWLLIGHPAPELEGVHATLNGSSKIADYKGKYVVLDFWGYWCGPCVHAMPAWIAVHDHFKGDKVAVVTVHEDGSGEVANAEQYQAKIKGIKDQLWKGRDLPFPVALVSRDGLDHGRAAKQYGVQHWPTTFLIGPDGKVIGEFDYRDGKSAIAALEAVIGKK